MHLELHWRRRIQDDMEYVVCALVGLMKSDYTLKDLSYEEV